jgi:hypothetical protein
MSFDFKDLKDTLNKISSTVRRNMTKYSLYLGGYHIRQMKNRISRGVDLSGAPFAPYNPDYAKRKLQRYGKLPSWLVASDSSMSMLQTLSVLSMGKPGQSSIIFGSQRARELSYYNEYCRKPRSHFGYTKEEETKLEKTLFEQVMTDIEREWNGS